MITQEEIEYLSTTTRYSNNEVYNLIMIMNSKGFSKESIEKILATPDPFMTFHLWEINQGGGLRC